MTTDVHPLIVSELLSAIRTGALAVEYQPVVDLDSGRITAVESLVRWPAAVPGLEPGALIDLAERSGIIGELGQWVLGRALEDLATWRRHWTSAAGLAVAVNVSPLQFAEADLGRSIQDLLERHGLPGSALWIEVTESAMLCSSPRTLATMATLHESGVRIAMDDFGTGYSTLAFLDQFPVDEIKLDRVFIDHLATRKDRGVILLTVSLAHYLGLAVVVEGVETEHQADWLRRLGGVQAQGFLFSPPLPATQVPGRLGQLAIG